EAFGGHRRADGLQQQQARRAGSGGVVLGLRRPGQAKRDPGPIATGCHYFQRNVVKQFVSTTNAAEYGSRLALRLAVTTTPSIRPEHELAVALEIGAAAHVELAVLADEEQRPLWHLLGALQQGAGIVGAHLV